MVTPQLSNSVADFLGVFVAKIVVICVTFLRIVSMRQMEWNDKITKKLITRRDFSS